MVADIVQLLQKYNGSDASRNKSVVTGTLQVEKLQCCFYAWDSAAGIQTGYGMEELGAHVRVLAGSRFLLLHLIHTDSGALEPPNQLGGLIPGSKATGA
jgi:hypothetical protein